MTLRTLAALAATALTLSACVVATDAPPPPARGAQPASSDVSSAAINACRNAVDAQTDGAVEVTGSEFSQANSAVYLAVGPQRAPWRCLVSNDGVVQEVMFMGEG